MTGKIGVLYNDRGASNGTFYGAALAEGMPGSFVEDDAEHGAVGSGALDLLPGRKTSVVRSSARSSTATTSASATEATATRTSTWTDMREFVSDPDLGRTASCSSSTSRGSNDATSGGPRRRGPPPSLGERGVAQLRRRLQVVRLAQPLERGLERVGILDRRGDPAVAADVARASAPTGCRYAISRSSADSFTVNSTGSFSCSHANMRLSATLNTGKPHGASSYVSGSESASSRIVLAARRPGNRHGRKR